MIQAILARDECEFKDAMLQSRASNCMSYVTRTGPTHMFGNRLEIQYLCEVNFESEDMSQYMHATSLVTISFLFFIYTQNLYFHRLS